MSALARISNTLAHKAFGPGTSRSAPASSPSSSRRRWSAGGRSLPGSRSSRVWPSASMVASVLDVERASERDRAVMPPSFVIDFASLLLFGPDVAMLVATAGAVTPNFAGSDGRAARQVLVEAVAESSATQFARPGLSVAWWHVGQALRGRCRPCPSRLRRRGIPRRRARSSKSPSPLLARRPIDRSWPRHAPARVSALPARRRHRRSFSSR